MDISFLNWQIEIFHFLYHFSIEIKYERTTERTLALVERLPLAGWGKVGSSSQRLTREGLTEEVTFS